jgi:chloramphenicol-sensitive protein RarD
MNNNKHYAAAISAFLIWGFLSLPLRALQGYAAGEILYFRILFSAAILMVVVFAFRRKQLRRDIATMKTLTSAGKRNLILLTLAGGALLTINWLTFIHIVNHINIKTASFSYLVCPVITAVLGYLILKEKLVARQWIAVALCAFSCTLIGISSWLDLSFAVLTASTYALYLITQRRNQSFDRMVVLAVQILFALIVLTLFAGLLVTSVPTSGNFYAIILLISSLFTVFPLFLNLYALGGIKSATIGILMYLNPLVNFTLAFVFFGEHMDGLQLLGFNLQHVSRLRTAKTPA